MLASIEDSSYQLVLLVAKVKILISARVERDTVTLGELSPHAEWKTITRFECCITRDCRNRQFLRSMQSGSQTAQLLRGRRAITVASHEAYRQTRSKGLRGPIFVGTLSTNGAASLPLLTPHSLSHAKTLAYIDDTAAVNPVKKGDAYSSCSK